MASTAQSSSDHVSCESKTMTPKPPFFVNRLPTGFTFGEICCAPKAQPQVEISRQDAIAKCLRSGPPLLGLGRVRDQQKQQQMLSQKETNDGTLTTTLTTSQYGNSSSDAIINFQRDEVHHIDPLILEVQTSGTCTHVDEENNNTDMNVNEDVSSVSSHMSTHIYQFRVSSSSSATNEKKHDDDEDEDDNYNDTTGNAKQKRKLTAKSHRHHRHSYPPPAIQYHILHTGNFVRVASVPGRLYWLSQNSHQHLTADWKLHISCQPHDIGIIWNLIFLPVFFEHPTIATVGCKAVLSATQNDDGQFTTSTDKHWPEEQRGREFTIYLFVDDEAYSQRLLGEKDSASEEDENDDDDDDDDREDDDDDHPQVEQKIKMHNKPKKRPWNKDYLWTGDDRNLSDYWRKLLQRASNFSSDDLIHLVDSIQQRLDFYQIATRGCADGDLPLTRNVSIRNEAYTNGESVHSWWLFRKQRQAEIDDRFTIIAKKKAAGATQQQQQQKNHQQETKPSSPSFFSWDYWTGSSSSSSSSIPESKNQIINEPSRKNDTDFLYPLNHWGWNAAEHELPPSLKGLIEHFNPESIKNKFYQGCKDFDDDDDDENDSSREGGGRKSKSTGRRKKASVKEGVRCTC